MKSKKLKIGFLINSDGLMPAWYAETIQSVIAEGVHEIFFIECRLPQQESKKNWPWAYKAFKHFENAWFGPKFDASEKISLNSFTQVQKIGSEAPGFILNKDASSRVLELSLDLIYTIDYDGSGEENLSGLASFGLWYLSFGNSDSPGPTAFWEVMRSDPVTCSRLLMKTKDQHYLLYDGATATVPHSVKNNFNSIAWKSSSYLVHRLRSLSLLHDQFSDHFSIVKTKKTEEILPGSLDMLSLFFKNNLRYLAHRKRLKNKDRFTLLYAFEDFQIGKNLPAHFQSLSLPPGCFFADPFLVKENNVHYVFFERWYDKEEKASIAMMKWNGDEWSSPETVLEESYHLSYPFVFKWNDDYYLLPESSSGQNLVLYKAKSFPYQWEPVRKIFDKGVWIDASLHYYENKWWLFASSVNHPFVSTNDQLFLYFTDDLLNGSWQAHPKNPLVTHAGNCRPAGRLFEMNGQLYRPAQNNASQQYGYGLKINRVDVMNETEYREKEVRDFTPEPWHLKAIHHLDFTEGLVMIDGILKSGV